MSTATASVADVSRTNFTGRNDSRDRSNLGQAAAQCTPMPLPALGTQRIIQGNGTNVGTVISLQCPAKHKLMGGELRCVMGPNSTSWEGNTYCKPLSPYEVYGFRVAVFISIVSSGIILFMSVAFITCCLLDCIKKEERKKQEREAEMWQWEEQAQQQQQEESRPRYSHKSRNNNNNNSQEKVLSLWDSNGSVLCEDVQACRCHPAYGPARHYAPPPQHTALPGLEYEHPLLPQIPESGPPQYPGPPITPGPSGNLVQISATGSGLLWQYGGEQNPSMADLRSLNSAKEFSIRIISV